MSSPRRTALVVGGTRGIGREIARLLVADGSDVTVVGRASAESADAVAEMGATFRPADVSDLDQVRALAADHAAEHERLDHLVQTADVIKKSRVDTADGVEVGFATNYLSRFLLVGLLLDPLRAARGRILHVAAAGAAGRLSLADVPPGPKVGPFRAHGLGQGANDVYGVELAARLAGSGIAVHVANPGAVDTGIRDEVATTLFGRVLSGVFSRIMTVRSAEETARVLLEVARAHPDDVLIGMKGPVRVPARARDIELRRALWRRTEQLTGLSVLADEPSAAS